MRSKNQTLGSMDRRSPAMRQFRPQAQPFARIEAVDALVVDLEALAPQQHADTAMAVPDAAHRDRLDSLAQHGVKRAGFDLQ